MFFSNSQSAAMVALLARSIERTCARIIYSYAMRRLTAVEVGCDEDCGPRSPSRHIDLRQLPSQRIADMWSHSDMSQRRAGCKRNSEFISALLDASNAAEATENTETNETNGGEELPAAGGGGANTMADRLDRDFPDPIVLVGRRVAG